MSARADPPIVGQRQMEGAAVLHNIAVSVVPVPAGVWLFAAGLGMLGWLRCKQKA
jgi:hypothetical protein